MLAGGGAGLMLGFPNVASRPCDGWCAQRWWEAPPGGVTRTCAGSGSAGTIWSTPRRAAQRLDDQRSALLWPFCCDSQAGLMTARPLAGALLRLFDSDGRRKWPSPWAVDGARYGVPCGRLDPGDGATVSGGWDWRTGGGVHGHQRA